MKRLLIGTIVNTHGLQGELKIKPKTHFKEERFAKGNTIFIEENGQLRELSIVSLRIQKEMLLVKFAGYNDINRVEAWKGKDLFVDGETLHALADDEIYYHELYDCEVFDEQQQALGKVVEVIETGANAVLRIKGKDNTFLLPYVKTFVKEVDKKEKKIIIHLVEGIL